MTTARDYAPGSLVAGKYEILGPLGRGGSAAVYRAKPLGGEALVALKVMHQGMPDGVGERERFAREASVVQQLRHPHIVRLLDFGYTEQGMPYLAFELLVGRSLEERIRVEGELDNLDVGRLSAQVLSALEKAHALEIVHRDIKPANIFLVASPMGEVARVLDFGLAKVIRPADEDENDVEALTRVGAVLGTPRYLSPEQARGESVGQAADIYSLGLVMAEMLSGRPVVDGKTHFDMFVRHGSDAPHELPPEVIGSPFAAIIRRAIDKEPTVRYRLASQMLADVEAVLGKLEGWSEDDREHDEADLVVTQLVRMGKAPRGATGTAASEQLRQAFNLLARDTRGSPAAPTVSATTSAARPAQDAAPLGPDRAAPPAPGGAPFDDEPTAAPTLPPRPVPVGFDIDEETTVSPDVVRRGPLGTAPPIEQEEDDDELEAATCVANAASLGIDPAALVPRAATPSPGAPLPSARVAAAAPAASVGVGRAEQAPTAVIDTSGWPAAPPLAGSGSPAATAPAGDADLGATAFLSNDDPVFRPPAPQPPWPAAAPAARPAPYATGQPQQPAAPAARPAPYAVAQQRPPATAPAVRQVPFATGRSQPQSAWASGLGPAFDLPLPTENQQPDRGPVAAIVTILIIVAVAIGAFVWLLTGP